MCGMGDEKAACGNRKRPRGVDSFGLSIRTAQPEVRPACRDGRLGLTLQTCALEPSMAIIAIFDQPGMTQAQYEQTTDKLAGGRGLVRRPQTGRCPA